MGKFNLKERLILSMNTSLHYYRQAIGITLFTILYNIIEGLLCTYLGIQEDSLTLLGFGIDSFIETLSGIGILQMLLRIIKNPDSSRNSSERMALRITGFSFYILSFGLVVSSIYNIFYHIEPIGSYWGTIISFVSIVVMLLLYIRKMRIGKAFDSEAILADAQCTRVCIYMSLILLLSNSIYWLTKIPYIDCIGALFLAYFSLKEGSECFLKANSDKYCGCSQDEARK